MHQAFRPIAVMLGFVLVVAAPAQAGPVRLSDVVQTITNNESARQTAQLQLRAFTQQSNSTLVSSVKGATQTSSTDNRIPPVGGGNSPQGGSSQSVETIQTGDVTGTICDCGEIVLPGGAGFPLWPLLGLAAVPLLFIDSGDSGEGNPPINVPSITPTPITPPAPPGTPTPVPPTPPPPPGTPIPEPATLLLFGSGMLAMGAGARRRRANRFAENLKAATGVGRGGGQ